MTTARVELPAKLLPIFGPARGSVRYRALHGGRGSGKSRSAATIAAIWGYTEKLRILCARELQVSIKESFHAELKAAIEAHPWLADHYDVGVDYLRGKNGTEFIFRGLRHNAPSIKSLSGIDLTIVEEAEDVPEESWLALEATVFRQPSSELWALWNPRRKGSPVDNRFRQHPPENALIAEINWRDNEFFPPGLDELRQRERERLDPGVYEHVWEGAYATAAEGAYYASALAEARREGRVGMVPRDPLLEVRAYWDIGGTGARADATAIWLVQFVGKEIRWLDHYEASGQPLETHVAWLRSRGYPVTTCVLPHDGATHDKVFAVSYESALRQAGFNVQVIPNQGRGAAMARIEALRRLFPSCWFHEATTSAGLDALGWYHEKRDDARGIGLGPEHDWASHSCLRGDALVLTTRGEVPIRDMAPGDEVVTPAGPVSVLWAGKVKDADGLVEITLADGRVLAMTPEHKVFTIGGVARADAIGYDDVIISLEDAPCIQSDRVASMGYRAAYIASSRAISFGSGLSAASTSAKKAASNGCCTGSRSETVPAKSSLLTGIGRTSTLRTGSVARRALVDGMAQSMSAKSSMAHDTTGSRIAAISRVVFRAFATCTATCGSIITARSRAAIMSTTSMKTRVTTGSRTCNCCAPSITCRTMPSTVNGSEASRTNANCGKPGSWRALAGKLVSAIATCAGQRSRQSLSTAGSAGRVVGIRRITGAQPVYDLTVPHHHCYVANGMLVSNSDAAGLVAIAHAASQRATSGPIAAPRFSRV